jgi:small subunit ribosomal protein S17
MPRRVLEGNIVSDKMDKTVTVLVERRYMHPVYKKYVRKSDKYAAHDEQNAYKTGDRVLIEECRPISKRKSWKVVSTAAGEVRTETVSAPKKAKEAVAAKPAKAKAAKAPKAPKAETAPKAEKAAKKPAVKKTTAKKDKES